MVVGPPAADHPGMTTEQPTAPRLLRRRGDDRVLGGVASGLADYFNVDPLLIRIGFVGLMVFNGLGLGLYLLAWLLVPTDTDNQSVVQRIIGRIGGAGAVVLGLVGLAIILVLNVPSRVVDLEGGGGPGGVEFAVIALIAIAVGAILFRRPEPNSAVAATVVDADTADAASVATPPTAPVPVVVRRPSRPPSPLGWYMFGAILIGIGLLAMATVVTGTSVDLVRYFGVALTVIGVGLLVGTWYGHARLMILLGLLLLPFAIAASLIHVPFEGGFGSLDVRVASVDDLDAEYRLAGGQIYIDLSRIEDSGEPIEIDASVAMGDLLVVLPDNAGADLDAAVGAGSLLVLGGSEEGTNLEQHYAIEGGGPQFVLDLGTGLGIVRVETRNLER
jgi:phage shock protein PspC (stress-responsive transcriptional regulator)